MSNYNPDSVLSICQNNVNHMQAKEVVGMYNAMGHGKAVAHFESIGYYGHAKLCHTLRTLENQKAVLGN